MKKIIQYLRINIVVIIILATIVFAGCDTGNNSADINRSYDAIKKEYANNSTNSEIAFIYNAINNDISEYPNKVPDFVDLPIECLIDAVESDERINIEYIADDNYDNGIIVAQEPEAGAPWDNGGAVNLTVNRKYSDINSYWGYMSKSSDNNYLLSSSNREGAIWADGQKLVDDEIVKLYVDDGVVYYNNPSGVYKLSSHNVKQILEENILIYKVINNKLYYIKNGGKLYCYNMNDNTDTLVYNEPTMLFLVNSNYITCWKPHDVFILDKENYTVIKELHFEGSITGCYHSNENVYVLEMEHTTEQKHLITKYNITQNTKTTVFESDQVATNLLAVDDKIVFLNAVDNQLGFRYIDTENMDDKYFPIENYDVTKLNKKINDFMFDGHQIIYNEIDSSADMSTFYSISIFTGEKKKIGSFAVGDE